MWDAVPAVAEMLPFHRLVQKSQSQADTSVKTRFVKELFCIPRSCGRGAYFLLMTSLQSAVRARRSVCDVLPTHQPLAASGGSVGHTLAESVRPRYKLTVHSPNLFLPLLFARHVGFDGCVTPAPLPAHSRKNPRYPRRQVPNRELRRCGGPFQRAFHADAGGLQELSCLRRRA